MSRSSRLTLVLCSFSPALSACADKEANEFQAAFLDQCIAKLRPKREPICQEVIATGHAKCQRVATPKRLAGSRINRALDTPERTAYMDCMRVQMRDVAGPKLTLAERETLGLDGP